MKLLLDGTRNVLFNIFSAGLLLLLLLFAADFIDGVVVILPLFFERFSERTPDLRSYRILLFFFFFFYRLLSLNTILSVDISIALLQQTKKRMRRGGRQMRKRFSILAPERIAKTTPTFLYSSGFLFLTVSTGDNAHGFFVSEW